MVAKLLWLRCLWSELYDNVWTWKKKSGPPKSERACGGCRETGNLLLVIVFVSLLLQAKGLTNKSDNKWLSAARLPSFISEEKRQL
jgi:hypothetical protein